MNVKAYSGSIWVECAEREPELTVSCHSECTTQFTVTRNGTQEGERPMPKMTICGWCIQEGHEKYRVNIILDEEPLRGLCYKH